MIATLSRAQIADGDFNAYVEARRAHINPMLARQPGFQGSTLLKARQPEAEGESTVALFNFWESEEAAKAWSTAPQHDEVAEHVIPLVQSITSRRYERIDDTSVSRADEASAAVGRISVQEIKPGRMDEYLAYRREVIHPSMEEADGFVGAWVFRDLEVADRLAIYFQWADDASAEAYFNLPFHLGEITDRVRELLAGRLSTDRFDFVQIPS